MKITRPRVESTPGVQTIDDRSLEIELSALADRVDWIDAAALLPSLGFTYTGGPRLSGTFERRARALGFKISQKREVRDGRSILAVCVERNG